MRIDGDVLKRINAENSNVASIFSSVDRQNNAGGCSNETSSNDLVLEQ